MTEKVHQVVIVGAGVSGLSAARFLQSHGLSDILLLEAKSKPGGRINTQTLGDWRVELGAQWIHGEENSLCALVKTEGHLHPTTSWEGKGDFLLPNGDKVRDTVISEILDWLENTMGYVEEAFCIEELQNNPKQFHKESFFSMGKYLKDRFYQYLSDTGVDQGTTEFELKVAVFQWSMSFQRIDNSCNQMTDLSLFRWSEFQVNGGELYNNFKYGAETFVQKVLVGQLPPQVMRCKCPVENVNWDCAQDYVTITVRNGQQFRAQCVLVTCSIGVLKAKLDTLFTPHLPTPLCNAINATGFGPIAKIFLVWDTPWWPRGLEGFQFVWHKEFLNCCDDEDSEGTGEGLQDRWYKSITGFDPVTDNPNALVGWVGGPEAKFVETLQEHQVGEQCVNILRQFTGFSVPNVDKVIVSKWNTDEFFGGAYCYRSTMGDMIHGDISAALSKPVLKTDSEGFEKPVITLAGEALSKTHYSTLHGAYESGESQAAKIIEYFRKTKNTLQFLHNGSKAGPVPNCSQIGIQEIDQLSPQLLCQFSKQCSIDS